MQSVKDVIQRLVDDDLVFKDKIGTSVFEFADKYRGVYSNGLRQFVCPYYCDFSGYQDELLWGAAWLHKATRNPNYLSYIQANGHTLGADESDSTFGWDNKHVGARILLSKVSVILLLTSGRDPDIIPRNSQPPKPESYEASAKLGIDANLC